MELQPDMPFRPGWGTLGEPGVVRTNFFTLGLPEDATYYDYEIVISPTPRRQDGVDKRPRIMQLVEQAPEFAAYVTLVAHDRSQRLVSAQTLPQPLEVSIRYLEEDQAEDPNAQIFTVEFRFRSELKMSQLDECVRD